MRISRKAIHISAAAFWIFLIFFGILPLVEKGYQWYYGSDSIYLITGTGLPILLSLILFAIVLWLFSQDGLKGYFEEEDGRGIKAHFSNKKKITAGFLSLFLTLACILGSMCWFQRFTLEGVEYHCFFYQKEYNWQDVRCFTLKADSHGSLAFEFQMKDGTKRSFNGGYLWCIEYFSDKFERQFSEDVYDYARWLGRKTGSQNIPIKAKGGWNSLMEGLEYDSWKTLAKDIRQCHQDAAADNP